MLGKKGKIRRKKSPVFYHLDNYFNIFLNLSTFMHIVLNNQIHFYVQICFFHFISNIIEKLSLNVILILYITFFSIYKNNGCLLQKNWKWKSIKTRLNNIIKLPPRFSYYISFKSFFSMNLFVYILQYWQPYALYSLVKCFFF